MALQPPRTGKDALADFLMDRSADLMLPLEDYPWPFEGTRWYELVYCLLVEAAGPHADRMALRELTASLATLNLLEVGRLTSGGQEGEELHAELERLIAGFGLAPEAAAQAVGAIRDAAQSIEARFEGHIQRYLRLYGERMLSEIDAHFRFTTLDAAAVGRVFTRWLQTAAAMPLSQMGAPVTALAESFATTPEAARSAADEIGMGLAVFDDVVASSHAEVEDLDRVEEEADG